jgi:hypothetical protein
LFKKERYYMDRVMAGFVASPEDWKYSNARDFCGSDNYRMKGLVEFLAFVLFLFKAYVSARMTHGSSAQLSCAASQFIIKRTFNGRKKF